MQTPEKTIRLKRWIAPDGPHIAVMSAYHTSTERHDHDFYELVYVVEGFCLHDAYGGVTLLMEGDLFILRPGVAHRYFGNRVTTIYNCVFSQQALGGWQERLARLPGLERLFSENPKDRAPRIHLSLSERKRVHKLLRGMLEECEERPIGWEMRLSGMLISLLVDYSRAFCEHVGTEKDNEAYSIYVAQALTYIDEYYTDPDLSVRAIAAHVGVSGDYLSRQFRQVLGIAAQEYLKRYRFARAMALLQTELPVGEVASQVGFRSLCHFSREFKKEMGVTPSQYRSQNDG